MKMWSGRFRQPLDPDFERWQRSFSFDARLLKCELIASNAHARALKAAGILSSDELIHILQGLKQIGEKASDHILGKPLLPPSNAPFHRARDWQAKQR